VPGPLSLSARRQEREFEHSFSPIAEVKNGGAIPPFRLKGTEIEQAV
jgi:hypothetical protein